jgi:hypothetical protein
MHAQEMTGGQKFALLLAQLANGEPNKEVQLKDIEDKWNRMTALLGGKFNRKYSNVAKERGWADTKKLGVYVLCPSWREILTK